MKEDAAMLLEHEPPDLFKYSKRIPGLFRTIELAIPERGLPESVTVEQGLHHAIEETVPEIEEPLAEEEDVVPRREPEIGEEEDRLDFGIIATEAEGDVEVSDYIQEMTEAITMEDIKGIFGFNKVWSAIGLCRYILGLDLGKPLYSRGTDLKEELVVDVYDFLLRYEDVILSRKRRTKRLFKHCGRDPDDVWTGLSNYIMSRSCPKGRMRDELPENAKSGIALLEESTIPASDIIGRLRSETGLDIRCMDIESYTLERGIKYSVGKNTYIRREVAEEVVNHFCGVCEGGGYKGLDTWRASVGILCLNGRLYRRTQKPVSRSGKIKVIPAWADEEGYNPVGDTEYALNQTYNRFIESGEIADPMEFVEKRGSIRLKK